VGGTQNTRRKDGKTYSDSVGKLVRDLEHIGIGENIILKRKGNWVNG
jgi:hypothetical protein